MSQKSYGQKSSYSREQNNRQRPTSRHNIDKKSNTLEYDEKRPLKKRPRPRPESNRQEGRARKVISREEVLTRESPRSKERQRRNRGDNYHHQEIEQSKKESSILIFSFLWNIVFYCIVIGVIMMSLMFSFSSKSTASIFGYRFYNVLTNSMVPQKDGLTGGFYAGDIVIVKLMDSNKLKKDDIVTFSVGDGSRYLTHRMVDRKSELHGEKGDFVITKGDANESNDPPVSADRIIGKVVFTIPKVGSILDFIREEFWACLVCLLSIIGFFLVLKAYLFTPDNDQEKEQKRRRNPSYDY